jgi:glycosyl transferase family 25
MKQIIEYFERSYIINLATRPDRKARAETEFRAVGVELPSDKLRFYTATRPIDKGNFSDVGTRGCFNSHKDILRIAAKEKLRNVLIFEDDVSFRSVTPSFEQRMLTQLSSEDWDVVLFGYLNPPDDNLVGPLVRWPHDILGMHFYAVNGRFIAQMLEYMTQCELRPRDHADGGPMPADGAYNHIRYLNPEIKVFLAAPNLAHQRSSRTDIAKIRSFDQLIVLQPIIEQIRTVKHQIRMALDTYKLRRRLGRHR